MSEDVERLELVQHRVGRRSPAVVRAMLEHLRDTPRGWADMIDEFTGEALAWRTAENMLYELIAFGAIARHGKPADGRRADTRRVSLTALGKHWLDGTDPPALPKGMT